jgi:glyoxylase-like metal-dependent hydrolase (beta-lactamase superfamily II)
MTRLIIYKLIAVVFLFTLLSQAGFGKGFTSDRDFISGTTINKSESSLLSNLKISFYKSDVELISWELNETFFPTIYNYTATVEKSYTATVLITPEQSPGTTGIIKINGVETKAGNPFKVELKLGDNTFNISVAAPDGTSETYKLTIAQKDMSKVYVSEFIAPGIWRIRDFGGFTGSEDMYLIEGKDRALLFDTGMGTGDLATYVKTLTKLPVDVAITHGNGDHFKQVDQFKESTVYISEKDITRLTEDLITPKFKMIKEGDVIDIGAGRRFEILEVPGHSLGCVIFLDSANKIAVVGDGVGSGERVHMYNAACTALDEYLSGLKKAEEKIKNLDGLTLLVGHHYQEHTPLVGAAGKKLITDMRILAEKVLAGEITGKVAYTSRGGVTSEFRQAYFGLAGLWYNPNNMITNPASLGDLRVKTPEGGFVFYTPVFSSLITNYKANIPANTESLNIQPWAYDQNHKSIVVNGEPVKSGAINISKINGKDKIEIVVTAKDGSTKTYTVNLIKQSFK